MRGGLLVAYLVERLRETSGLDSPVIMNAGDGTSKRQLGAP